MSRIGKHPIPVPSGVTVTIDGNTVTVKGPKGELSRTLPADMTVAQENGDDHRDAPVGRARSHKALHGLSRTLVANMVEGVTKGFTKQLEIVGRRLQGRGAAVRAAARARLLAPDRVQGAGGHQAHGAAADADHRSKARTRRSSARWRRRSAVSVHPSRTRARASSTQGEQIRRKAGKAGGK